LRKSLTESSLTVEQTTEGKTKKQGTLTKEVSTSYVGNLKISITKAEDLEKKDILQKADPYVIVRLGSQTSKSEKVKNTLEPVWNHEVTLDLERTSPKDIEIELMDWERIGKDEPMGKILLPVGTAVDRSLTGSFWLALEQCKSGKIQISTEFQGTEARNVIGEGVRGLKKILHSEETQKSQCETDTKGPTTQNKKEQVAEIEDESATTVVKSVTRKTTTTTMITRKVAIGPDGKEYAMENTAVEENSQSEEAYDKDKDDTTTKKEANKTNKNTKETNKRKGRNQRKGVLMD